MSSVQLALYCCANSSMETDSVIEFFPFIYNGLCAGISILSMFGALYIILPSCKRQINHIKSPDTVGDINQHSTATTYTSNSDVWERSSVASNHPININESYLNHRKIIFWLTIADFLAVFAVLIKSALWMILYNGYIIKIRLEHGSNIGNLLCAILSTIIRFFYTATFFWTLCYALEVYRKIVLKNEKNYQRHYQIFTWGLSTVLVCASAIALYSPGLKQCYDNDSLLLLLYLTCYLPALLVMVAIPILYYFVSREVQPMIEAINGDITNQQRKRIESLRWKFWMIVIIFYICWIPNIIECCFIYSNANDFKKVLWMIMGLVNPLQALLNAFVYRSNTHSLPMKRYRNVTFTNDEVNPLIF